MIDVSPEYYIYSLFYTGFITKFWVSLHFLTWSTTWFLIYWITCFNNVFIATVNNSSSLIWCTVFKGHDSNSLNLLITLLRNTWTLFLFGYGFKYCFHFQNQLALPPSMFCGSVLKFPFAANWFNVPSLCNRSRPMVFALRQPTPQTPSYGFYHQNQNIQSGKGLRQKCDENCLVPE